MPTIKYSDLDKDLLKYALEGNEVHYAYDPLKKKLQEIDGRFHEMETVGQSIRQKLQAEASNLQMEVRKVAQELDHQRYLLKSMPTTSDDEDAAADIKQKRAQIQKQIEQCEQTIKNIQARIAKLDEAIRQCEQGLSVLYSGRSKFSEALNGVSYCEDKLRDTCNTVCKSITSAEKAISSYLGVGISDYTESTVTHIRRK